MLRRPCRAAAWEAWTSKKSIRPNTLVAMRGRPRVAEKLGGRRHKSAICGAPRIAVKMQSFWRDLSLSDLRIPRIFPGRASRPGFFSCDREKTVSPAARARLRLRNFRLWFAPKELETGRKPATGQACEEDRRIFGTLSRISRRISAFRTGTQVRLQGGRMNSCVR